MVEEIASLFDRRRRFDENRCSTFESPRCSTRGGCRRSLDYVPRVSMKHRTDAAALPPPTGSLRNRSKGDC